MPTVTYQEVYEEVYFSEGLEEEGYYYVTVRSRMPISCIPDTGHKYYQGVDYEQLIKQYRNKLRCPRCGSVDLKRAGHNGGEQRYQCKPCGRDFHQRKKRQKTIVAREELVYFG